MIRSIVGVVVGYLVFALPAYAFFRASGQAPHQPAPVSIMVASTAVGIAFALLGGYLAAWIAARRPMTHGLAVAAVLAAGALASLLSTRGHGAIWSQVAALVFVAPGAAVGGWLRARQVARPAQGS